MHSAQVAELTTGALARPLGRGDAALGAKIFVSAAYCELVVALALLAPLMAALEGRKTLQTVAETLLLVLLFFACSRLRLDRLEVWLLASLFAATAVSFVINPAAVFIVNAKQFSIAILTLILFSKVRFRSRLILPAVVISIVMLITALFAPDIVRPYIDLARYHRFNTSRFGGLFLNAHFNGFFIAIFLIYCGYRVRLLGTGVLALYLTGSKFVLVSYVADRVARFRPIAALLRRRVLIVAAVVILAVIAVRSREAVLDYLTTNVLGSAAVIFLQIIDIKFYLSLLNPFPGDYVAFVAGTTVTYQGEEIGNEIALFAVFIQGGAVLATMYLYALFQRARYFRVFLGLTLLHYGFVLAPLMIYMLVTYSREIELYMTAKRMRAGPQPLSEPHD